MPFSVLNILWYLTANLQSCLQKKTMFLFHKQFGSIIVFCLKLFFNVHLLLQDMQCNCVMGLFPEVSRAWLAIDSDIYFWVYEDGWVFFMFSIG